MTTPAAAATPTEEVEPDPPAKWRAVTTERGWRRWRWTTRRPGHVIFILIKLYFLMNNFNEF